MITNLIVNIINFVTKIFVKYLPDLSVVNDVFGKNTGFLDKIYDFVKQVNYIIPLDTIVYIIGIEITIHVILFSVFIVHLIKNTICDLIP